MQTPRLPSSKSKVEELTRLMVGRDRVLILMHDNPDPDAMAGALCLCHLIESLSEARPRIVYGGIVGRADNRNMVGALDIPLWTVESIKFRPDDAFVLVDTQPGFANNSLPEGAEVLAVIDHHEGPAHPDVGLLDVRTPYGAVCTILTEYLVSAEAELPARLATAICYAIGTETQDLGREAHSADIAAFMHAFPLCDQRLLGRLRHPRHTLSFFVDLDRAIRATRIADGVAFCPMGRLSVPDAAAEMADMLVTVEDIDWVLCTGIYQGQFILSLRTIVRDAHAGELLRSIVAERSHAGGHDMIAGGSFELDPDADVVQLQRDTCARYLEALGRDAGVGMKPLLAQPGVMQPDQSGAKGGEKQ